MINKLELRHGNYVLDRAGKTLRIDWFERDKVCFKQELEGVEVHPLTESFSYLEPITLTEEILLKCDELNDLFMRDKIGFVVFKNTYAYQFVVKDYRYLHQLQNLYFELANKELEINL